jgi:hypothetical protein
VVVSRQRRGWSAEIRRAVEHAAVASSASAATVLKDLEQRFGQGVISERTLRDWLGDLRRDPTEPWEFTEEEDPADVAYLLRIQGAAIETFSFKPPSVRLTVADARELLRLRDVFGGLLDRHRYLLVRLLVNQVVSVDALQDFLAFRPWLGEHEGDRYRHAVEVGVVSEPIELFWWLTYPVGKKPEIPHWIVDM